MALTDDRVVVAAEAADAEAGRTTPPSVSRGVALLLFVLTLISGSLAVYFAAEARDTASDAEILLDGVDRSRLPREEAVALALLARNQSAPVPPGAEHSHDNSPSYGKVERTPEEQAVFDEQWAAATGAVSTFDTLAKAEALGYVRGSAKNDGSGSHYIKWSLVDRPFDPARPSMLLFDELTRGGEPELIAYSYWVVSEEEPEGFAGDEDSWHQHLGVCFINGWIMDENYLREECAGDWVNGTTLWMLHAWVVPGLDNDYGRFHNVNPLLCERACGLEN